MAKKYDVVIVGGGPAGLTAGLYAARDRFQTLIIERAVIGGNITNAEEVDNYPGYPEGISGVELTAKMHEQATKHGAETLSADVNSIEIIDGIKHIRTSEGDFQAGAVIIASGTERAKLEVEGEKEFTGRGVSYCATCDGPFFKGKKVAVVGGGNAALYEALHLSKFAAKVYLIHRRDAYRATMAVQEKMKQNPVIEPVLSAVVSKIRGGDKVSALELSGTGDGKIFELEVDGIFVSVGLIPNTSFVKSVIELDGHGSIKVDEKLQTSASGIFAAGDIRSHSIRQVVTAAGDGAHAAFHVREYLEA
ncbi:MAG: thioredoxin-disulfide reductase [Dehalococcoidaceae bacterium]|nr:thioredoxin-disulfide reductase [Dehalococcoidaceae bacterium]